MFWDLGCGGVRSSKYISTFGNDHKSMLVRLRCVFSKLCSPRRAGKITFPNDTNPTMFGSHRLYNGCNHFHMQIRFKNTADAFKHVPDLF